MCAVMRGDCHPSAYTPGVPCMPLNSHVVQVVTLVSGPGSSVTELKMNLGKVTASNAGGVIRINSKEK